MLEYTVLKKYTVPEVAPLVKQLYRTRAAGCCLHIVLDDGNVEDGSVKYCINYAKEQGHNDCDVLANILLSMSKTQRKKLGKVCYH